MSDTIRGDLPRQRSVHNGPFGREPRIGILVVAYNAATTLAQTWRRPWTAFPGHSADVSHRFSSVTTPARTAPTGSAWNISS